MKCADKQRQYMYIKLEGTHRVRTHVVLLLTLTLYPNLNIDLWPLNLKTIPFLEYPKVIP